MKRTKKLGDSLSKECRAAIYLRDGLRCLYCRSDLRASPDLLTLDHLNSSGSDEAANLVTSCRRCNTSKARATVERFAGEEEAKRIRAAALLPLDYTAAREYLETHKLGAKTVRPPTLRSANSLKAAAGMLGIPVDSLRRAKNAGCPAFRNSRVFIDEYEQWIADTPLEKIAPEGPEDLEQKEILERRKLREQLLSLRRQNAIEEGSIVTRADVAADMGRIASAMQSRLSLLVGECPNWAGLQAHELQSKAKEFVRATHEAFHDATGKLYAP